MKNTSCGLIFRLLLFLPVALWAQADSLRVMSYNLLMYPSGTSYSRDAYLSAILDDYRPDLLAVCEIETEQASDWLLSTVLQPIRPTYAAADFEPNHSDPNSSLQQMLYYDSAKWVLNGQSYLVTEIRDINKYHLYLKTTSLAAGDTLFLDVYVVHLKASTGMDNENKRLRMIRVLTDDLRNVPPDHYVLVAGDFNFYYAGEPAFAELTDTTNAVVMTDPVSREGYWHENRSYADLHTQSPNRNKGGNFVGGGLDDRFDFIFISENLSVPSAPLHYKTGTYAAYGNNGNCFNGNINDPACGGYYSQTLRNNLYEMSDHLPVVMTLETDRTLAATVAAVPSFRIYPNPATDYITVEGGAGKRFRITDQTGKIISENMDGNEKSWYIGRLKPGIYYVQLQNGGIPVAFIKQ